MEKELIKIKKEIAKLKTRIFDLETKMNETTDKIETILILVRNALNILEKEEINEIKNK